jgi:GNAT superfamily N-acetyltransferase
MDFELQAATADDESFLAELFYDVRGPEFAALPEPMRGNLLAMQQRAQSLSYAERFPSAVNQIVRIGRQRAGRLLVSSTAEEIHLVDVALLSRFRGQGVGTKMVGDLCRRARAENVPLRLAVQGGNPARRLYERLGFVPIGSDGVYIAMELGEEPKLETAVLPEPAAGPAVEAGLTQAYFQSLHGRSVQARSLAGLQTELTVTVVEPLTGARSAQVEMGDSFRVEFLGPLEVVLPPETIEIAAPGHAPQALFVSPLGPVDGAMRYEAIFNRAQMRS